MRDIKGPAHPDHPANGEPSPALIDKTFELVALRVRFRDLAEELDASGDHGAAELIRARLWESTHPA